MLRKSALLVKTIAHHYFTLGYIEVFVDSFLLRGGVREHLCIRGVGVFVLNRPLLTQEILIVPEDLVRSVEATISTALLHATLDLLVPLDVLV